MKKLLALVLTLSLLLTACSAAPSGSESGSSAASVPSQPGSQSESSTPAAPVAAGDFDSFTHPVVKAEGGLKVGYLVKSQNSEATIRSLQQAEIECAHRGWTLVPIVYEVDTNFRDSFQNLVNQGVDAIIVGSGESQESKVDLFESARQKGIGVYCNDNTVVSGIISNCTMPNGVAGVELFYKVAEDYGWDLNICFIENNVQEICVERIEGVRGLIAAEIYPKVQVLAGQDYAASGLSAAQGSYELGQAWIQKYGDELDCIFTCADTFGINAAEAIAQAGDTNGDRTFTCGVDGGSRALAYIRNQTPFRYSYAQPFELYTHSCFEIIDAIQVKGLNPGDEGCPIARAGETLTFSGYVLSRDNCPDIGTVIHACFDYYDPNNAEAWYNWTDGPGAYVVEEYIG